MSIYKKRREELISKIFETDSILITSPKNVFYLTGFYSDPHERFMGLLWNVKVGWTLILPKLDVHAASLALDASIESIGFGDDEPAEQKLNLWLEKTKSNQLWIEENILTYDRIKWIYSYNEQLPLRNLSPFLNKLRVHKNAEEYTWLAEAGKKTDLVLKEALSRFQRGMSETDLVAEIEYQAKKAGAQQMAFGTSVLFAGKSALPHGKAADRRLDEGVLLIDYGMVIQGYCSDMTRTFHIGSWEDKIGEIYDTVLRAEKEAIRQVKIGMTFADVDALARQIIDEEGYGEYFIHRLGHGMGLDVHEYPSVGAGNNDLVGDGMVFTIEPGIYIPNFGGVRIEDSVIMRSEGAQTLTHYPKEKSQVILE